MPLEMNEGIVMRGGANSPPLPAAAGVAAAAVVVYAKLRVLFFLLGESRHSLDRYEMQSPRVFPKWSDFQEAKTTFRNSTAAATPGSDSKTASSIVQQVDIICVYVFFVSSDKCQTSKYRYMSPSCSREECHEGHDSMSWHEFDIIPCVF